MKLYGEFVKSDGTLSDTYETEPNRCPELRGGRDWPEERNASREQRANHDALYRCVYHKGHAGPHWQYGTKWMLDTEHEVQRLNEAIRAAMDELGVPGDDYPAPVSNAWDILNAAISACGEKLHWKASGNRIIPDHRPRCQATHPDQGPCELPDAHAGKHGWALPKVSENT